jgi:hypothetical protein
VDIIIILLFSIFTSMFTFGSSLWYASRLCCNISSVSATNTISFVNSTSCSVLHLPFAYCQVFTFFFAFFIMSSMTMENSSGLSTHRCFNSMFDSNSADS